MTNEARASAIRQLLKEADIHLNALEADGYEITVAAAWQDRNRSRSTLRFAARKQITEKL